MDVDYKKLNKELAILNNTNIIKKEKKRKEEELEKKKREDILKKEKEEILKEKEIIEEKKNKLTEEKEKLRVLKEEALILKKQMMQDKILLEQTRQILLEEEKLRVEEEKLEKEDIKSAFTKKIIQKVEITKTTEKNTSLQEKAATESLNFIYLINIATIQGQLYKSLLDKIVKINPNVLLCRDNQNRIEIYYGPYKSDSERILLYEKLINNDFKQSYKVELTKDEFNSRCNY